MATGFLYARVAFAWAALQQKQKMTHQCAHHQMKQDTTKSRVNFIITSCLVASTQIAWARQLSVKLKCVKQMKTLKETRQHKTLRHARTTKTL